MRTRVSITLLSASLTAATAFAAQAQTSAIRPNYDAFYAQARAQIDSKAVSAPTLRELTAKQQRSASGYKSTYDQLLGTTTFLWGNDLQAAAVGPVTAKALPAALGKAYLSQKAAALGLNRSMIEDAKLLDTQLTPQGGTISRYQQRVGDIEVFNRRLNVLTDGSHRLVAISGSFQPNVTLEKASGFSLDATRAIRTAIGDLGGNITPSLLSSEKRAGGYLLYGLLDSAPDYLLERPVRVKQVYFPLPSSIEPAYYLEVVGRPASLQRQDGYSYVISATTGEILFRNSLIAYEGGNTAYSYRVFADDSGIHQPYDSPLGNTEVPFAGATPEDVPVRGSGVANLISLVSGPISTGDAWLPDDATTTTGNHADAYLDSGLQLDPGIYFNNQPFNWPGDGYVPFTGDLRSEMTGDATFDYPVQADDDPSTDDAKQAAIVNLFYMNNWLHDWWYDHGFDEVAGNAQIDNYGRGGVEGDPIQAQGQDGGGRNNANMLTPSDGGEPRMQMYLFDGFVQGEVCQTAPTANCPSTDDGEGYVFSIASFGPDEFDVTGDVVLVDDGSEPVTNGCNDDLLIPDPLGLGLVPDAPLPNPIMLAGKIALIDRGECSFTTKEQYAMLSGADAMVVINNGEGNPITMGNADIPFDIGFTTDGLYTTPAVMITKQDGETLKTLLAAGETVSLHLLRNPAIDQDGTFDNLVIAHEYFHYVSNRLVADGNGLSNNQGRSLGEGWGDISAWMLSVREDDSLVPTNALWQGAYPSGYYVLDAPYYGIRRMPYSANFDYNFLTFKHIEDGVALEGPAPVGFGEDGSTNSEVHNAGEVWANAMLHAYTMLLNRPELSFSEAQARMKDYIICGMKMTPASPTYTEARDGVLACAMSADLADFGVMAKAFALRGMGIDAVSPDRSSTDHAGVVESFISLSAQAPTLEVVLDAAGDDDCDHDGILDAGETGVLRFSLLNNGAYTPGQTVTATLSSETNGLTLVSGANLSFTAGEIGETTLAFVDVALADDAASPLELVLTLSIDPPANADETIEYPETVSYSVLANYDGAPSESDDLESPELAPLGWTASSNGTTTVWELTDQDTYTGSGTGWFAPNLDTTAEIQLITPAFVVPEGAEFTFSFDHYYSFEVLFPLLGVGYDGGVIDVSVDGGDWVDAEEFGANFSGGYTGNIQANSRAGYVGANGSVETETLDFGTSVAGQSIRLRFTVASDSAVGDIGWIIDNVNTTGADPAFTTVSAEDGVCGVAPTPTPTATPTPTPTGTTTPTPTPTGSVTPTPSTTATPTPTSTPTPTPTGSVTPTPTPTGTTTPTPTPSTTATPTPTSTPTPTPTGSVTPGPTASPTPTPMPTGTVTPTPTASVTPSPTPTAGGSSNGGSGGGSMGFGLLGLFAVALGLRRRRRFTA